MQKIWHNGEKWRKSCAMEVGMDKKLRRVAAVMMLIMTLNLIFTNLENVFAKSGEAKQKLSGATMEQTKGTKVCRGVSDATADAVHRTIAASTGSAIASQETKLTLEPKAATSSAITLPEGFVQRIELGKAIHQETGELIAFGTDAVDKDSAFYLRVDYKIPKADVLEMQTGQAYTFDIIGRLTVGDLSTFRINREDGELAANGTITNLNDQEGCRVELTFVNQEILAPGTEGNFYIGMDFAKDAIGNQGKQDLMVSALGKNWSEPIYFNFDQIVPELTVTKEGILYLSNGRITWTITAEPVLKNADLPDSQVLKECIFTDILSDPRLTPVMDGLTSGKVEVTVVDEKGVEISGIVVGYDETAKTLTVSLPENQTVTPKTRYIMKFQTAFDYMQSDFFEKTGTANLKNEAKVKIVAPQYERVEEKADPNYGTTVISADKIKEIEKSCTETVKVTGCTIDKKGALLDGESMQWTIQVHNTLDLENPVLKDTLPAYTMLDATKEIKISTEGGETVVISKKNKAGSGMPYYTQTIDNSSGYKETLELHLKKTTQPQTITYYTKLHSDWEKQSPKPELKNNVVFTGGPGPGISFYGSALINPNQALLSKSGTYAPSSHEITWTVQVKAAAGKQLKKVTLTDIIPEGQEYVANSIFAKGANGANAATNQIADEKAYQETDKKLTISYPDQTEFKGAAVGEIKFKTRVTNNEHWAMNVKDKKYSNSVVMEADGIPGKKVSVSGTTSVTSNVLLKEYKNYNFNEKMATWQLTVNSNQMKLTQPKIVDTASEGWNFDAQTVQVTQGKTTLEKAKYKVDVKLDGRQLDISLPDMQEGDLPYLITYKLKLIDNDQLQTNQELIAKNTAVLTAKEMPTNGQSVTEQKTVPNTSLIKKTGDKRFFNQKGYMKWEILVNNNLSTVTAPQGYNSVVIEDTLQENLEPIIDQIKVYKLSIEADGSSGSSRQELIKDKEFRISYESQTRKLCVDFLQKELTEAYLIEVYTDVLKNGNYSNRAGYAGMPDDQETADSGEISLAFAGGMTKPTYINVEIQVYEDGCVDEAGHITKFLKNARFCLYQKGSLEMLQECTANERGRIQLRLKKNGSYELRLEEVPEGYKIPEEGIAVDINTEQGDVSAQPFLIAIPAASTPTPPTLSPTPTIAPTDIPTAMPTSEPPTMTPTMTPTTLPTTTPVVSTAPPTPTVWPTAAPSMEPTAPPVTTTPSAAPIQPTPTVIPDASGGNSSWNGDAVSVPTVMSEETPTAKPSDKPEPEKSSKPIKPTKKPKATKAPKVIKTPKPIKTQKPLKKKNPISEGGKQSDGKTRPTSDPKKAASESNSEYDLDEDGNPFGPGQRDKIAKSHDRSEELEGEERNVPKTGDTSPIALYAISFIGSFAALIVMAAIYYRRRKTYQKLEGREHGEHETE